MNKASKIISFAGHLSYTIYEPSGIGRSLRKLATARVGGKVTVDEPQTHTCTEGGQIVAVRILEGELEGKFLDIDERSLRVRFPGAPEKTTRLILPGVVPTPEPQPPRGRNRLVIKEN